MAIFSEIKPPDYFFVISPHFCACRMAASVIVTISSSQPLGIVAVDYSENYPDKESERCHTKHDEDIP